MNRVSLLTVAVFLLVSTPTARSEDPITEAWEVVYSESLAFESGQAPVVLSWSDGLQARRFHLRLDANQSFDATLVRDRDGTVLYDGRRMSRHRALIPWGRDETAHLSVDPREGKNVWVVLELAVDPREKGLAVFSFEVNHFLRLYEAHEMRRGKEALALALSEDPVDSIAIRLWTQVWNSEGMTVPFPEARAGEPEQREWLAIAENLRLDRMDYEADTAFTAGGFNAALSYLDLEDVTAPLRTRYGRRGFKMLLANLATRDSQYIRAVDALDEALDLSEGFDERGEVYRLLVEANQRQGNEAKARSIQQRALREAPDASARQQVENWLSHQP